LIGYSGSGKTQFILNAIELLRINLNYQTAVIKNIHEHQIDKENKDSYKYAEAGAKFSITKNVYNETTIFLKEKIRIEKLLEWIAYGPYKIDLIFIEGFRNLDYPTILCAKNLSELESQLTNNVRMIMTARSAVTMALIHSSVSVSTAGSLINFLILKRNLVIK